MSDLSALQRAALLEAGRVRYEVTRQSGHVETVSRETLAQIREREPDVKYRPIYDEPLDWGW